MNTTEIFHQYLPMMRKRAHAAHRQFNRVVEYDDMEAQAFLIFSRALADYQPEIGSFSTYLYHALRALWDYGNQQRVFSSRFDSIERFGDSEGSEDYFSERLFSLAASYPLEKFLSHLEAMECILRLSDDAHEVLNDILGMAWYKPELRNRVTILSLQERFRTRGWAGNRVARAYRELKTWWNDSASAVFA